MSFNNYKSDFIKLRGSRKCHIELAMGNKTDDGRYIATGLSVCPWPLLIVTANAILIGNRLLRRLNGIVGLGGHN
jgi:hypothetical protein